MLGSPGRVKHPRYRSKPSLREKHHHDATVELCACAPRRRRFHFESTLSASTTPRSRSFQTLTSRPTPT